MRLILALSALALAAAAHAQEAPAELSACLAAVESRYAGETERNLSRGFAVAAQTDVILNFDEADALFGRRTEVGDAHGRYANQEVSYLIARIERFAGVQLLASNMRRAVAAGFDRRSRYAGIVVVETETGARVVEFTRADRRRALDYIDATLRTCPP
ncbi:MAG: AAA family ATPase [Hyphomonadaceae bacterium]